MIRAGAARRALSLATVGVVVALAGCAGDASTPARQLATPASENCVAKGGQLVIETAGDGGQYGVRVFEDNRQCEEWALLRGACPVGGIRVTGYVTPQARYCAIRGGDYRVTEDATATRPRPGPVPCPASRPAMPWPSTTAAVRDRRMTAIRHDATDQPEPRVFRSSDVNQMSLTDGFDGPCDRGNPCAGAQGGRAAGADRGRGWALLRGACPVGRHHGLRHVAGPLLRDPGRRLRGHRRAEREDARGRRLHSPGRAHLPRPRPLY